MKNKIIVLSLPVNQGTGLESALIDLIQRIAGRQEVTIIHSDQMGMDTSLMEVLTGDPDKALLITGVEYASEGVRKVAAKLVRGAR
jgi:hypothetical protein